MMKTVMRLGHFQEHQVNGEFIETTRVGKSVQQTVNVKAS